jgi:hypothetical protein
MRTQQNPSDSSRDDTTNWESRETVFLDAGEDLLNRARELAHQIKERVRQITGHAETSDSSSSEC